MAKKNKEWFYGDESNGQWIGPMTISELDEHHRSGNITDYTRVVNTQMLRHDGPMAQGITYSMISRLNVEFSPSAEEFFSSRNNIQITVLSGPNNSGKTLFLKQLFYIIGQGGYLINCNRFSHVDTLNTRATDEHEHRRYYDNFVHNYNTSQQNTENNELQLQQIITSLKNHQRDKLFRIAYELLGNKFSLQRTDPENEFSPFYVDMDGENLRYGSTGTRLLLTLLGIFLDERFSTLLIDEPEIGLSPKIQAKLAKFIYDPIQRKEYLPHLKQIYVATHSHLFLDRNTFSNNYVVSKQGKQVSVNAIRSGGDLHRLQFNLLGNELESVFLPSAIVLVEGDSDVAFMTKLSQVFMPDRKIAIVRSGGDGEMQNKLNFLKEALGEINTSPYKDRLFIVLDKKHSLKKDRIINQGVNKNNIVIWSKNGIEYYYPQELVSAVFHCDIGELTNISFERDPIEYNGIRKSKKELANIISEDMTQSHELNSELKALIDKVVAACE